MDRLHLPLRSLILALVLASLAACSERQADVPEDETREAACMVSGATGYWEDGRVHVIYEWATGHALSACLCLTEEEFTSKSRVDELNDIFLEACEQQAALKDFDWNDCQDLHDSGEWLYAVWWARDEMAWARTPGLSCSDDEDAQQECSIVPSNRPGVLGLGLLVVGLGLRRRRSRLVAPPIPG